MQSTNSTEWGAVCYVLWGMMHAMIGIQIWALFRKLTQTPARITQAYIVAVTDTGWRDETVEDVLCITSLFAFFNRMADGVGIKAAPALFAQLGPDVAPGIYEPMFQSALPLGTNNVEFRFAQ